MMSTTACAAIAPTPVPLSSPSWTAQDQWTEPPVTAAETAARMGTCLSDKGWDVETNGFENTVRTPPEQRDQFQADVEECADLTGASAPGIPLTSEYLTKQYNRTIEFRSCLVEQGYSPPELLSEQAYRDLHLVEGQFYDLAALTGIGDRDLVREECKDPLLTWGRE